MSSHPSYDPAKFHCHKCCGGEDESFSNYHMTKWLKIGWGSPTIYYYSAKNGGHKCWGSADIKFFIC